MTAHGLAETWAGEVGVQLGEVVRRRGGVVEIRRGRKVNSERKFFPGYVLVKMEMTDDAYHLVKNTPKVTGFLGAAGGTKPLPVSEREVQNIIGAVEEGVERPKPTIRFDIGETVKVIDGPFASFDGQVESVDEDNARLRVAVSIFGRPTPVDLEYNQVEKVAAFLAERMRA